MYGWLISHRNCSIITQGGVEATVFVIPKQLFTAYRFRSFTLPCKKFTHTESTPGTTPQTHRYSALKISMCRLLDRSLFKLLSDLANSFWR